MGVLMSSPLSPSTHMYTHSCRLSSISCWHFFPPFFCFCFLFIILYIFAIFVPMVVVVVVVCTYFWAFVNNVCNRFIFSFISDWRYACGMTAKRHKQKSEKVRSEQLAAHSKLRSCLYKCMYACPYIHMCMYNTYIMNFRTLFTNTQCPYISVIESRRKASMFVVEVVARWHVFKIKCSLVCIFATIIITTIGKAILDVGNQNIYFPLLICYNFMYTYIYMCVWICINVLLSPLVCIVVRLIIHLHIVYINVCVNHDGRHHLKMIKKN